MAEYHVAASPLTDRIYAGRVNKAKTEWVSKSDVTDEAIEAVREHLYLKAVGNAEKRYGYEWTRIDGGKVRLVLAIIPSKKDKTDSEGVN